eukprot:scaffold228174_cov14-Prasinocladus_malaysianus.AAC.1
MDSTDSVEHGFRRLALTEQALRLMVAVVAGHAKAVGASKGMSALAAHAPAWDSASTLSPPDQVGTPL